MTRHDIAVTLLASMISTGDGLNAIFESAGLAQQDPHTFAAKAAIKFADALQDEFDKEFLEKHKSTSVDLDKVLGR